MATMSNLLITGLTIGEQTGSRIFLCLWPYVLKGILWWTMYEVCLIW